jgi:hypothetical protein
MKNTPQQEIEKGFAAAPMATPAEKLAYINAHTFLQACLGGALALFVTLVMVQLFGLL